MKTVGILVRVVWVTTCVAALVFALRGYDGHSDWRVEEGLALEMMVLAFPASFLVAFVLMLVGMGLQHVGLRLPSSSRLEMAVTWFPFVIAGYVQWFIVIPGFMRLWREMLRNDGTLTKRREERPQ